MLISVQSEGLVPPIIYRRCVTTVGSLRQAVDLMEYSTSVTVTVLRWRSRWNSLGYGGGEKERLHLHNQRRVSKDSGRSLQGPSRDGSRLPESIDSG